MKIIINHLSKKFKDTIVLNDINLTFESGKIYGLIGQNGSGKSVLLKIICSFYKPSSGEVLINGINYNESPEFPKNLRAFVDKPAFLPDLSGYENLKILADIQKIATIQDINYALDLVNLFNDKDKKFGKYSMGMKQKLGVASVIMENPDIMILDEPFNGIEEDTKNKIISYLSEIKKDKIILVTSHISDEIKALCDEVFYFEDGKCYRKVD